MLRKAFAVCLIALAGQANAGLIVLTADTGFALLSDFSVTFNDTSDGLLQIGEVTGFSGVTIAGFLYPQLTNVPNIPGIATGVGPLWTFSTPSLNAFVNQSAFAYSKSTVAVPEPGTLALFGAGLLGLGLLRLRRRVA